MTIANFFATAGCFESAMDVPWLMAASMHARRWFHTPQGTEILQSAIPPEQAVARTFSDLSTLWRCHNKINEAWINAFASCGVVVVVLFVFHGSSHDCVLSVIVSFTVIHWQLNRSTHARRHIDTSSFSS